MSLIVAVCSRKTRTGDHHISVSLVWCSLLLFFFSSRRRHTRLVSDWSSDVCSSDLEQPDKKREVIVLRRGAADDRHVGEVHMSRLTARVAEHLLDRFVAQHEGNAASFRAIGILCDADPQRQELDEILATFRKAHLDQTHAEIASFWDEVATDDETVLGSRGNSTDEGRLGRRSTDEDVNGILDLLPSNVEHGISTTGYRTHCG